MPRSQRRQTTTAIIVVGVLLSCIVGGSSSFVPATAAPPALFRVQAPGGCSDNVLFLWSTKNGKGTQTGTGTTSLKLRPLSPLQTPKSGVVQKKKKQSPEAPDPSEFAVKRPRGRPRKTTTDSSPSTANSRRGQQQEKPVKAVNPRSSNDYSRYEMLDHELLTADEEQILGNKVKRAIELRKEIKAIVEPRQVHQKTRKGRHRVVDRDEDDDTDVDANFVVSGNKRNTYYLDNFQDDAMAQLSVYRGKGKKKSNGI
jgi:hypothetical protein